MKTKLFGNFFARCLFAAVLSLSLSATSPKEAQAQGAYINGDLGSFADFVCNGHIPGTNLAQIMRDIMDQLAQVRADLILTGGGGGSIGDPSQCLPGFNPNMPQLPGLGDLSACFDFSGFGNIGANIGNCLSGVLGQFGGLEDYFSQFNWNYQDLVSCLQGLLVPPTIPIPQFLENLSAILNNILALLASADLDFDFYNGSYNFWVDFCNNHYSANGYMMGGGDGAGGGGSMINGAFSGGPGSMTMTSGLIGPPGGAIAPGAFKATGYLQENGSKKVKKYALRQNGDKFKKTVKNLKRGKTYKVRIELSNAQTGAPIGQSVSSVKVN